MAKVVGATPVYILYKHLLPGVFNTLMVVASLRVGTLILTIAVLSYLGVGVPPPTPEWGSMVSDGRDYIDTAWWITFLPRLGHIPHRAGIQLHGRLAQGQAGPAAAPTGGLTTSRFHLAPFSALEPVHSGNRGERPMENRRTAFIRLLLPGVVLAISLAVACRTATPVPVEITVPVASATPEAETRPGGSVPIHRQRTP